MLVLGNLVHKNFLLDEEINFSKANLPTRKYEKAWLETAAQVGFEAAAELSGFKTFDKAHRLQRKKVYQDNILYIKYLKSGSDAYCLSQWDKRLYKGMIHSLRNDVAINRLIHNPDIYGNVTTNIEKKYKVEIPYKGVTFTAAAIYDNYFIDNDSKERKINDLKTTHTLEKFKESVTKYNYDMQGALYAHVLDMVYPDTRDYTTSVNFAVVDKSKEFKTDIITMSSEQLENGKNKLLERFEILNDYIASTEGQGIINGGDSDLQAFL